MKPVTLKIPATSANLGLGFDSMGLAVNKFLSIEASESPSGEWIFEFMNEKLESLPKDSTNLVAQTAIKVAQDRGHQMPALSIKMDSQIPLAHGLGSSSTAIVSGIELADSFCPLNLSEDEKIYIGTEIEGHPDNIGPCFTGGVFVGYFSQGDFAYKTMKLDRLSLIVSVPGYEIATDEVRKTLPSEYSARDAVLQNAKNNVMLLAMYEEDYELMGKIMMEDCFHEPYRSPLIKEFSNIKHLALEEGAYATVISGAGPTLLTLCPPDKVEAVYEKLQSFDQCDHEIVEVYYKK